MLVVEISAVVWPCTPAQHLESHGRGFFERSVLLGRKAVLTPETSHAPKPIC